MASNLTGASTRPLVPRVGVASLSGRSVCRAIQEPPPQVLTPFEEGSSHLESWSPESWRQREALQQPKYPDKAELSQAVDVIKSFPPLVFAGECRTLQQRLADAAKGENFVLFGMPQRRFAYSCKHLAHAGVLPSAACLTAGTHRCALPLDFGSGCCSHLPHQHQSGMRTTHAVAGHQTCRRLPQWVGRRVRSGLLVT